MYLVSLNPTSPYPKFVKTRSECNACHGSETSHMWWNPCIFVRAVFAPDISGGWMMTRRYVGKFPPKYIFKRVRYCTLCILSNGSMRWVIVYEAFYMPLASLELWFACTLYSAGQKNVAKGCVRCGFYHAVFNHVFWRAEYSSAQDNFIKGFLCRLQNCLRKQHIKPFTVPSRVA